MVSPVRCNVDTEIEDPVGEHCVARSPFLSSVSSSLPPSLSDRACGRLLHRGRPRPAHIHTQYKVNKAAAP